jgi:glucuronate isomerase
MRSCGISEEYITGDKSPYEKFKAWASAMPNLIGNPLYHWTHLELQRYFDIYEPLSPATCDEIWEKANAKIKAGGFTPRELIEKSNVNFVCTTDDAADTLEYHKLLSEDKSFKCKVLPAFRPDKALGIELPGYCEWVQALEAVMGKKVESFTELKAAMLSRIEFFKEMGCRASDHAFTYVPYNRASEDELNAIYKKRLAGEELTTPEVDKYKTELMLFLANEYARLGWGMEIHIGAMRNNNGVMFKKLGPDTGYDSVADYEIAVNLSRLLDAMNTEYSLPKTVLFTLNPKDNYVLGTMLGNFQGGGIPGKIQFGSGWWFNDQRDGMESQMRALSNLGMLARFIGMLTDSRSFVSYTRHEYFRRILCNLIGKWVEDGEYPRDMEMLKKIAEGVCYYNAKNYFDF